jgi:hypothetical protein
MHLNPSSPIKGQNNNLCTLKYVMIIANKALFPQALMVLDDFGYPV